MSADDKNHGDLTGRSRFGRNVAFAWGGFAVNVIAGFIMPRLISDHLGQVTLGIWDFAWSVVSYFGLVQLGLSASVDRYVQRYRALGDHEGLSRSVSTIALFLSLCALVVVLLACATAGWGILLFKERLGLELNAARWGVLFLGLEVAFSIMFTVYGGVIVGCHRWDIHNTVSALCNVVMAIGMALVILLGGGLPALALVHCFVSAVGDITRWRLARRVCPELDIAWRKASWKTWMQQARFSAKSLLPRVAGLLSNQSLSVLIATGLGPASLAIYSRPRNLVQQLQTLAAKFGYILMPTASSMQAQADHKALRETFRGSTFSMACLALPAVVPLALFGDYVIRLWMGQPYVCEGLMTIMALGSLAGWVQEPIWSILAGMNRHGWVAWAKLAGAIASALLVGVALLWLKCSLLGAALGMVLPQMLVDGVFTPLIACRFLHVPLRLYFWETWLRPLLCIVPYGLCLSAARVVLAEMPWLSLGLSLLGLVLLSVVYWVVVLPRAWKHKLTRRLSPLSINFTVDTCP
jgi:O-antigen/teichoic acid export membrane protein